MIYLERHVEEDNIHRFYTMVISRDLFGAWVLIRTWGRVGAGGGQAQTESFEVKSIAMQRLATLEKQKRKRGYGEVIYPNRALDL